jgi:hypothetical protein
MKTETPISTNSWARWQTPVILALWETGIPLPGQPKQKSLQDSISMEEKLGVMTQSLSSQLQWEY